MNENKEFKPYIPADKITPEFTVTSIIMGVILAVIFGAANAYLGLRVGMTVSASIPAAVISMGVIRKIMKKNSILESNMVLSDIPEDCPAEGHPDALPLFSALSESPDDYAPYARLSER